MAAQKGIKMRKMFSVRWLLFAAFLLTSSAASYAQIGIGISVGFAPPELPVYEQPLIPGDGYIWTPGYWAYDDNEGDYYWVPGTWVEPPQVGYLWTPPYWGYDGGYRYHEGYWGTQVGFYGGISYGYGYFGNGYEGGRWDHDHFYYNRSVNNINVNVVHNTYNTTVINNNSNRVSYNGGNGGINARPTSQQEAVAQERHIAPVAAQQQHIQTARNNPELRASANHGAPPIAATARPAAFSGQGVVAGRNGGTPYTPPANHGGNNNANNARPANNNAPNNAPNNNGGGNNGGGNASRPPTANNAPNNNNTHNTDRPPTASTNNPSNNSSNANKPNSYSHAKELPPVERAPAPNTGNPKTDQKYQQQQQKVYAKQDQQRQQLATKQEQDHQRLAQQQASQQKQQQVEQRHQQQTQQLQQQHTQQVQKMQQKQQPPPQQHQAAPAQQQPKNDQKH
jgi:WXXGXW repeat (2 copies)